MATPITASLALPAHEIAYVQILSNTLKAIAGNDFILEFAQLIIQYIAAIPQWHTQSEDLITNSKWIHNHCLASDGNSSMHLPAGPKKKGVLCKTPIWPGDRVCVFIKNSELCTYCEVGVAHIEAAKSLDRWLLHADLDSTFATFGTC
jgi:hypothetical protein